MNRIETLAYLAKDAEILCDVGCDHAYSLILAIKKYGVKSGIAADVATGPLNNAKTSIFANNLSDKIEIVLSDGFKNISNNFDTAIISGMGGNLICDILTNSFAKIKDKTLILEANCDVPIVRKFLNQNNFKIIAEEALYDQGKYYEIIKAIPGNENLDEFDLKYGPILRIKRNYDFLKYYKRKIQMYKDILGKITNEVRKENIRREFYESLCVINGTMIEKRYINNTLNYYTSYYIDNEKHDTIVVCPGGGYAYTSPRESEPVALEFNKLGYNVVVVNYLETKEAYPMPGTYVKIAIEEIAKDDRVGKIIGMGFSAGGHCILELLLHKKDYNLNVEIKHLILGYPVVTANPLYAHNGSFENLLQNKDSHELRQYLSLETQVQENEDLEVFLWGTYTDQSVPVMNSLLLIKEYLKCQGTIEYHMFPYGGHGLSVCNEYSSEGNKEKESPYIARWIDFADNWLKLKLNK